MYRWTHIIFIVTMITTTQLMVCPFIFTMLFPVFVFKILIFFTKYFQLLLFEVVAVGVALSFEWHQEYKFRFKTDWESSGRRLMLSLKKNNNPTKSTGERSDFKGNYCIVIASLSYTKMSTAVRSRPGAVEQAPILTPTFLSIRLNIIIIMCRRSQCLTDFPQVFF